MGRIRLQGQTKDVYQADSRVKEMLHKVKAELMEQEERAMLAQFVRIGIFVITACSLQTGVDSK